LPVSGISAESLCMMIKRNQVPASVWRDPVHFSAFGFGAGASPYAPGTVGTLPAVLLVWLMSYIPIIWYLCVICLLYVAGVWVCAKTSNDIGVHDHPGVVVDEVVGYLIAMILVPVNVWTLATGFLVFRFFDIVKPWPICWLDKRVDGGTGIMIDDVVAGVFSLIVMQLLLIYVGLPPAGLSG